MNVSIIKEDIFENNIKSISDFYEENKLNFNENIKFICDRKSKSKIDIVAIFSNSIDFIEEEFKKYKEKEKILIITNNFEPKHVISCLLLTENLFSLRKPEEYLLNKMIKVYHDFKKGEKLTFNV